jgi:hypothetical protein
MVLADQLSVADHTLSSRYWELYLFQAASGLVEVHQLVVAGRNVPTKRLMVKEHHYGTASCRRKATLCHADSAVSVSLLALLGSTYRHRDLTMTVSVVSLIVWTQKMKAENLAALMAAVDLEIPVVSLTWVVCRDTHCPP